MDMSQGKGVKKGHPIPSGYIKVQKALCRKCKEEYSIVYMVHEVDAALALQHSAFLAGYLEGEHVDPKHTAHLDVYEPLDWGDSK
jgi:hypothetical protein